jgi:hypothetical protein
MKFLGHKVSVTEEIHGNFKGEIVTDLKRRPEGVRVKHRVDQNSEKMYHKAHTRVGSVLRVEMTMNNVEPYRVYRPNEGDPDGESTWKRLRRGIADLHRRAEISQHVNERYLDALAAVDDSTRLQEVLGPIEKRKQWKGRSARALHPFSQHDGHVLEIVVRGEFMIRGMCNKDLRDRLYPVAQSTPKEAKRRSAQTSRQLRLLRAHSIIHKISGRNLYQVSELGRVILTTFLIARVATANQLMKKAA